MKNTVQRRPASARRGRAETAALLLLTLLLLPGVATFPGCRGAELVNKALVTKRALEFADELTTRSRQGYDVTPSRVKWNEAVHAYGNEEWDRTNELVKEARKLLADCNTRIAERLYYRSLDGTLVSGLLFKPEGAGPWPLIVLCHAGFGEGADFSDVSVLVRDQGYLVFNPDWRGSGESEGKNEGALGEVDDTIAGIKYVRSLGLVEGSRIGMFGQSHGGAVAMLTAARYSGIKAVVEEAGFADTTNLFESEVATTNALEDTYLKMVKNELLKMIGGMPEEVPEAYAKRSAIHVADRINCPVYLIHGEDDPLVPSSEATLMYNALKAAGKTAEVKIYENEPHCVSTEQNRNDVWRIMFEWFERYV